MEPYRYLLVLLMLVFSLITYEAFAQCDPDVNTGQNLVKNHDFADLYSEWQHDSGYTKFQPCESGCYSTPGNIYAGTNPDDFNNAFDSIGDHTPTSDNRFLMVDGLCEDGVILWEQKDIPVEPNTNYYFEIWVTSISDEDPRGELAFEINGTDLGTTITAPDSVGEWVKYQATWNSGASPGPTADISIVNTQTSGCSNAVDFAVDDITFTPGCQYGAEGPMPDLGPDFTLCGKSLPITLEPNFDAATQSAGDVTYTWYRNGTTIKSGTGSSYYSHDINTAGTYTVCVDSAGSCKKTDRVEVTSTYNVDLGPDQVLCSPPETTLDAGYSGPGVEYQWYKDGLQAGGNDSSQTYYVNNPGTYSVEVTDPGCGTESDTINITSSTATPNDTIYCPNESVTVSVDGTGNYKWFDQPTGGTELGTGDSYTSGTLTGGDTVFYAEDTTTFQMNAGPSPDTNVSGFSNPSTLDPGMSKGLLVFNAHTDFILDSITVLVNTYYCVAGHTVNLQFSVKNQAGNHVSGSPVSYTFECDVANSGNYVYPDQLKTIPMELDVPEGNGYTIQLSGSSTSDGIMMFLNKDASGSQPPNPNYQYPTMYKGPSGEDVVEFASNSGDDYNLYYHPNAFPGYFDWDITKGVPCDRTPVQVTENCALPVDYIQFDAEKASSGNVLQWSTASERNNAYFIVQRSTDGESFTEVGRVQGHNTTAERHQYTFTDSQPAGGANYYRLVQVDENGRRHVSKVVSVSNNNSDLSIKVFPNPFEGSTVLQVNGDKDDEPLSVKVVDLQGRTIIPSRAIPSNGKVHIGVNLAPGVYYLKVAGDQFTRVRRIIKR